MGLAIAMRCITITCPMIANSFSEEPQRYQCYARRGAPFLETASMAPAPGLPSEWKMAEDRNPG
jgi:hypothetical protein